MKKPQQKKSAGKAESGNVTIDLGEKHFNKIDRMIDTKLNAAGMAGPKTGVGRPASGKLGSYRSGNALGNGYRPWYSRFGRPWLGNSSVATLTNGGRRMAFIPAEIQMVRTADALTGVGLGLLGNRALVRLTPMLTPTNNSLLLHQGIAFVAGLLPLLFKRNAMTVGVAIPGAVYLGGSLVDMLFNALGMPQSVLAGSNGAPRAVDPNVQVRQRLASIQQRINTPGQRPLPRVVAQPQYA